jgi:hypothetical protein
MVSPKCNQDDVDLYIALHCDFLTLFEDRLGVEVQADSKKPGRRPKRPREFVDLAGNLWLKRDKAEAKITQLRKIAAELDQDWIPPDRYLEGEWATELRTYNSRNSHSKAGPVKTWSDLVAFPNKHRLLRGMVKLLSRCAGLVKN